MSSKSSKAKATTPKSPVAATGKAAAAATGAAGRSFMNTAENVQALASMSAEQLRAYIDAQAAAIRPEDVAAQKQENNTQIADMQAYMKQAKADGLLAAAVSDNASTGSKGGENDGGGFVLHDPADNYAPLLDHLQKEGGGGDTAANDRLTQARDVQKEAAAAAEFEKKKLAHAAAIDAAAASAAATSAAPLRPALPAGAATPAAPTDEQVRADPQNPVFDPQPIKERVNRYTPGVQQTFPDGVAGYAADGTAIPINNEGKDFNPNVPDVLGSRATRNRLLTNRYEPDKDKAMLYPDSDANGRYMVVTMIGKHCRIPVSDSDRCLMRVWGWAKSKPKCQKICNWVRRTAYFGEFWDLTVVDLLDGSGWAAIPPIASKEATATYSNPLHREYMESYLQEQKRATVELEQRVMEDKLGSKQNKGNTLAEQLRRKDEEKKAAAAAAPAGKGAAKKAAPVSSAPAVPAASTKVAASAK